MGRAIVIGAGIGGLATAVELARRGVAVCVLERAPEVGGKMRRVVVDGEAIDSGPTVLTMRSVFDQLFADAGEKLEEHLSFRPLTVLARHAWTDGTRFDLFTDPDRSAEEITSVFGSRAARGYRRFGKYTQKIWESVEDPFMTGPRPTLMGMISAVGLRGLSVAARIDFRRTMWKALGEYFEEPKLRQLFARYATYYGSDPFKTPATLNLIAHVEQKGVWVVDGGMHGLARALADLAERKGAQIRTGTGVAEIVVENGAATGVVTETGERLDADIVVSNADPWALAAGRFGAGVRNAANVVGKEGRSLSAITWSMIARTRGFPLLHHNVFFSDDYTREFGELSRERAVPSSPTVYVCAQHVAPDELSGADAERGRLLLLVNAPPRGDEEFPGPDVLERAERSALDLLSQSGLSLEPVVPPVVTTPRVFEDLFPSTGGALYGPATHGWKAPFARPASRTKIRGLYLAGGGVHPGAGVPLVAMSGRFAAQTAAEDLDSTLR